MQIFAFDRKFLFCALLTLVPANDAVQAKQLLKLLCLQKPGTQNVMIEDGTALPDPTAPYKIVSFRPKHSDNGGWKRGACVVEVEPKNTLTSRLDVPIFEHHGDGKESQCAVTRVHGLKVDGDGFLSVRSGPGTQYREVARLHNDDRVFVVDENGPWLGVIYGVEHAECDAKETRPTMYEKQGWVSGRWIERN